MTTKLHFYGSVFELAGTHDDEVWRTIVQDRFDLAQKEGTTLHVWFDLASGGHVTIPISRDSPLAVETD